MFTNVVLNVLEYSHKAVAAKQILVSRAFGAGHCGFLTSQVGGRRLWLLPAEKVAQL